MHTNLFAEEKPHLSNQNYIAVYSRQNTVLFLVVAACITVTFLLAYNVGVMKVEMRALEEQVKSLREEMQQLEEISRSQQRLVTSFIDAESSLPRDAELDTSLTGDHDAPADTDRPLSKVVTVISLNDADIDQPLDTGIETSPVTEPDHNSDQDDEYGSAYWSEYDPRNVDDEDAKDMFDLEEKQWLEDLKKRLHNPESEPTDNPNGPNPIETQFGFFRRKRSVGSDAEVGTASSSSYAAVSSVDVVENRRAVKRERPAAAGAGTQAAQSKEERAPKRRHNKPAAGAGDDRRGKAMSPKQGTTAEGKPLVAHYEARIGRGSNKYHVSAHEAPVTLPIWQASNVTSLSANEALRLDEQTGSVTFQQEGLYYTYVQIVYHDTTQRWAFGVFVNNDTRIKCINTEQNIDSSDSDTVRGGRGDSSSSPHSHGVYQHCYTAAVLRIQRSDVVSIRCLYGQKTIVMQPEFTFWGVMRVGSIIG